MLNRPSSYDPRSATGQARVGSDGTRAPRADRAEAVILGGILATVAVAAGWASFTHVHDWTMSHAPAGTPDAFGWVNAVISELVPVAAFLTINRRRRAGQPFGYPLVLLVAAATLSLAAQLAVAEPSGSGWLLSAVPALAFMALVKLVFGARPIAPPVVASERVASPVSQSHEVSHEVSHEGVASGDATPRRATDATATPSRKSRKPQSRDTPKPQSQKRKYTAADRAAALARMPAESAAEVAISMGCDKATIYRWLDQTNPAPGPTVAAAEGSPS